MQIQDRIKQIKKQIEGTNIKLSVKIRAGWDKSSINFKEVGYIIQDNGADFIVFHARTRSQMFSEKANWQWIRELNEYLDIDVVGNGDIVDYKSFKEKVEISGVNKVMIARAAFNNPLIFTNIKRVLKQQEEIKFDKRKRLEIILKHLEFLEKYNHEIPVIPFFRKHLMWYLKGLDNARDFRDYVTKETSLERLKDNIIEFLS